MMSLRKCILVRRIISEGVSHWKTNEKLNESSAPNQFNVFLLSNSFWYCWYKSASSFPCSCGTSNVPPYLGGNTSGLICFVKDLVSFPWKKIQPRRFFCYEKSGKSKCESVDTYPLPQFLLDERFEYREQHVENVRIVENVHGLQSQRQHLL